MRASHLRARIFVCLVVNALLFALVPALPSVNADDEDQQLRLAVGAAAYVPFSARAANPISVFVRLAGDPVAVEQAHAGRKLDQGRKDAIKSNLKSAQDAIVPAINAHGGTVVAQLQSAINGIHVDIDPSQVAALQQLPGVLDVTPLATYEVDNTVSVPFIGAPATWDTTSFRGEGVKVGIIDTGIDYTHKNFGGPGTVEAWNDNFAKSTQKPAPGLFGPKASKVKGGIDLVGDAYNANSSDPAIRTPHPDSNPLDCNGHGSHVAGTAAGFGVRENGTTYKGPWTTAAYSKENFVIGPGVAPLADLYAIRVFGCSGSTNVVVEALDWAVDNDMDVVNMSLGSNFGRFDSADAIASDNAAAAGVIVVAASGNAGTPRYITSSPAAASHAISVAADDSTPSFPALRLVLSTGPSIVALNANGASVTDGTSWPIVVLRNSDGTVSLGCNESEYVDSVITGKLVVTARGTCARVARAVFGQKHGAAAVAMINNASGYPPFEGPITGNPDTGEAFNVTIPFLGIQGPGTSADATAIVAADGGSATATNTTLANPSFEAIASFSSIGPRRGDSALKPEITAPGVSIMSTAMGTGNQGERLSGTSMATPHVAGSAALTRQAHPTWSVDDIKAALLNTADPGKVVNYQTSRAGAGVVQPLGATTTAATASGDAGLVSLSFGFTEIGGTPFSQTKTITVTNHGATPLTFTASTTQNAPFTRTHTATLSSLSVIVAAGGSATLGLTLALSASNAGGTTPFREVAGLVTLTPAAGTNNDVALRVPYYLVPRGRANLNTTLSAPLNSTPRPRTPTETNAGGGLSATATFYTWGIADADNGLGAQDVRAVGVRKSGTTAVQFAVNTWRRWSSPNIYEFDIPIDLNGDGIPEFIVFTDDFGLVTAGAFNGQYASFVFNVATNELGPNAFLASVATDNTTVTFVALDSDIGLSAASPRFDYTVAGFNVFGGTQDNGPKETGHFNAFTPALTFSPTSVTVAPGSSATASITVTSEWNQTPPKGLMVVAPDNFNGAPQAQTIAAAP